MCEGNKVWYFFVTPECDLVNDIRLSCSDDRKNDITIFIHLQFLLDEMTDEMLDYISRDGGYSYVDEDYGKKLVEVYSMACVNGACQYGDYEEWGF